MKQLFLLVIATVLGLHTASAWGTLGHETVVEIAKRHLTEQTKANIAKYMPYDITKDARWMDNNRKGSPWPYSNDWHSYYYDAKFRHDPNMKIRHGDTMRALDIADRNLSIYKELADSAVIYNIRMILHFAGDMHCPSHCKFIGGRDDEPTVYVKGEKFKSFHALYDRMPEIIYGNECSAPSLAEQLDTFSKGQIKRICKGDHYDWAQESMRRTNAIHQWNPNGTSQTLRDDTIERSKEIIDTQLRLAGYRLAYLLNLYFGE